MDMDMDMEKVGKQFIGTKKWSNQQTFLGGEYSDERKAKREGQSQVSSI